MAGVGEAEGGGVTRLEQRGGVAIAFMAAASLIPSQCGEPLHHLLWGQVSDRGPTAQE